MGFPAEGVEGYFRNSLNDIARYLLERHSNHFLVFNLSERVYDVERMENRVLHFPWPGTWIFPPSRTPYFSHARSPFPPVAFVDSHTTST